MGMPVIAIGSDRAWRYRLERMVTLASDVNWCGSFAADSAEPLQSSSLWLLDGDDPAVERFCSRFDGPQPIRLYFYRRPTAPLLRRCVQVGGIGCLAKHASVEIVLHAIRSVGAGLFVVDASLLQHAIVPDRAVAAAVAPPPPAGALASPWPQLTGRQHEIVRWVAQGLSNKQIGRRLGISPETVKSHLHHVFERAGISGRVALLAAVRRGRSDGRASGRRSSDLL
ncbi:helix-turn-helix transcriptional regulator [Montanilutibacter psychrotolerans]|uniref:DNA-binding response regulator n=1 Tax=Montanilutibacter psychrotolerans TaxID=1327343 RepID=A0A3M8SNG4_9GAMM|nr:response regulator transcription factor [Lysobacter psychrotolerans]RNF82871.1 DNA-binding response regulator [Lysobacter psychrotolerans]